MTAEWVIEKLLSYFILKKLKLLGEIFGSLISLFNFKKIQRKITKVRIYQ